MVRIVLVVLGLVVAAVIVLWHAGRGGFGTTLHAGRPTGSALPPAVVAERDARIREAAPTTASRGASKQVLFGDLHVHSSFSLDAFQLTLPSHGGEGVHPVADACDFARFCAGLDFWSINDHAGSLDPRRWQETIDAVRACEATSADRRDPDLVSFLGWEWTQVGSTPENHYGHKNVILRDLEADRIPTRPISARPPPGVPSVFDTGIGGPLALGLGAFTMEGGHDTIRALTELTEVDACPDGVPVRDLPIDCQESAATPRELFAKLADWDLASMVIPHGTTWGMYTPPGSSWAKQLSDEQHDPQQQPLLEIYSGHGNAEEFRPWTAMAVDGQGARRCPAPSVGYLPSCWQAGEIVRARCLESGAEQAECEARASAARQHFVDADRNAGTWTVPGIEPDELLDAGQCTDCFQPAFNYRPLGSAQYMLALGRPDQARADRFRFGFIASSDNHTARPGTGYKERWRREFTDARMGEVGRSQVTRRFQRDPEPFSQAFDPAERVPSVAFLETERGGSFFLTGGLAAVHATGRSRQEIWSALERRETYGTSGPRILLWFDLLDPAAPESGAWPMGSVVTATEAPSFRARAVGSFEQQPGCPDSARRGLMPERLEALCRGECAHPSERRRPITRIEVVRIRPQRSPSEPVAPLIEDPWRVFPCPPDPSGCEVVFSDPDFVGGGRSSVYYVRAIEVEIPVVAADPLGCTRDAAGACVALDPCFDRADDDDCLAPSEQRAWSSPIFVEPAPVASLEERSELPD